MDQFLAEVSLFIEDTISWFSSKAERRGKSAKDNQWFQGDLKHDFSSRGEEDEVKEPLITLQKCSHVIAIHGEDEHHLPSTKSSEEFSYSGVCSTQTSLDTKDSVEDKTLVFTIPDAGAPKENGTEGDQHKSFNGARRIKKTNCSEQVIERMEEVKRKGVWLRDYCTSHKILLVGEGDFSFSVCLAKTFGSAANMVATSLDSLAFLEENYPSSKSHLGYLKKRGCNVIHEVDATKMAENVDLNASVYDRIIFNFPLAGFFNESKNVQLKRNRNLVRLFFKNARNLIACDGEVHVRHKSSSFYREWNLENLASQAGFKLIEDVEFKLSQYRGYNNKYRFGGNENFNCYPSRTYKFVLKDDKIRVVGENMSWIESDKDDKWFQGDLKYDFSSRGEDDEVKQSLIKLQKCSHVLAVQLEDEHHLPSPTEQFTKSSQESSDSDKCLSRTSVGMEDREEDKTLVIAIPEAAAPEENGTEGDQHRSTNGAQRLKKASSSEQVTESVEEVMREDKWIGDYCSSHKILLVGEGDFSFSVCLAKAFGSAANMVATSLDSLAFLEENYPSSKSHIGFLKKRRCTVIHELDATKMAENLDENDFVFDRIIFNFPVAGFFNESKKVQLKRNRSLVRLFFENAKKLIACDGEVHVRHKSSSSYREWNLECLADQAGFKLIEDVEFKLSQYRGYNNKYKFGGNENFNCYPSRTYKFVLKDEKIRAVGVVGEKKSWRIKSVKDDQWVQGSLKYDFSTWGEDDEVNELLTTLQKCSHVLAIEGEDEDHVPSATEQFTKIYQELSDSDRCLSQTSLGMKDIEEDKTLVITIPDAVAPEENGTEGDQNSSADGAQRLKTTNSSEQVKESVEEVKREDIWIGDYCSSHKILLVGEGDFSFSVCLAKAFGSAANMVATSLDSSDFLEENYPSATSHIGYLKKRGCSVRHEVDATKMAEDLVLNDFVYDRVIFNFPLAGFFNESKKVQLKRNRNLVRLFFENAKKLLACDGEVHIRHKSSSTYREWNLESLAGQAGFKLIADVEFKLSQYRGYNNKYGFGGNENFNCNPSRTYKFVLKDEKRSVVGENKSSIIKSVKDDHWFQGDLMYDSSSRGEDDEAKEPLVTLQIGSHVIATQGEDEHHVPSTTEQLTKSSQELSNSDKCFTQTSLDTKDIVEDKTLVITIPDAGPPKENGTEGDHHSSINGAQRLKKTNSSEQVKERVEEVKREDIWIGDYSSSHTILLVGEGDFSFAVCLAKAFVSAANMVATSLDSLAFLEENYPSSKSHIGYLKKRGCNVIHEVDATKMAENLDVNDWEYDRIIFNFPLAGFFNESKKAQLKRNRNLVRRFFENAQKLIACDGEVHIRHKSSSSYREWNLASLARQAGFKLIEDVEFKLSQYRGYNNKYGFGGNENFNCNPSRTYKFVLKDENPSFF